jgi:hypothetical protein
MMVRTLFMNIYHNPDIKECPIGNSKLYLTYTQAFSNLVPNGNYIATIPVSLEVKGEYKPLDKHGYLTKELKNETEA